MTASGPGLQAEGVALNAMTEFTVDASKAGQVAPLDIVLVDADSNTLDVKVTDNKNATYTCKYTPLKANVHTVCIAYGGVAIPSSPFKVLFLPATRYYTVESVITLSSSGNCPFAKSYYIVVRPTASCFADWSKRRHVTLRIVDCQELVEYLQHVKS